MDVNVIKDIIPFIIGAVLSSALDIAVFCTVAAMPLAALVYLSIISEATAMIILVIVAIIVTMRVLFVTAIKYLNERE